MNGDGFDQVLRSALEWRADEAARELPSLERSVRRLAERLGSDPERLSPIVVARTGSGRGVQLAFVVLLLLALLAAALAIGSRFVFRPSIEPPPFGYEGECLTPESEGLVYMGFVGDVPVVLYEDGLFVKVLNNPGETRSAIFEGMGGLERRLSPRGIELIHERVAETLPEPGCRHLRAETSTGEISIFTAQGLVELSWHPSNSGRRLTTAEEAAAESLEQALATPETWLPAEAWIDATERKVTPDRWLVMVELTPTLLPPGKDPRYSKVVLPDGQEPTEFGEQVATREGTTVRCGVLDTDDARRLSESLDALPLKMHDEEPLYTEDLASRVFIYIATGYPREPDCGAAGRNMETPPNPTPTALPTPGPDDDLAGVDPCSLMPASVDAMFGSGVVREARPSTLAMGTPARSCYVVTSAEFAPSKQHAALTLYPRSVDAESATALALSVFGGGLVEETIAGRPAWVNECLASALQCTGAIAAWSDPYFIVIEFDRAEFGSSVETTLTKARSVADTVIVSLPE
jgi:hypothetical protein